MTWRGILLLGAISYSLASCGSAEEIGTKANEGSTRAPDAGAVDDACDLVSDIEVHQVTGQSFQRLDPEGTQASDVDVCVYTSRSGGPVVPLKPTPSLALRLVRRGGRETFQALARQVPGAPPAERIEGMGVDALWTTDADGSHSLILSKGERRAELKLHHADGDLRGKMLSIGRMAARRL